jgi:hypothetical protein
MKQTFQRKAAKPPRRSAASRNQRADGGWKRREKSQGNVCLGNNPENAFSHSLDNHSPDFALDSAMNRMGGLKILAKISDTEGLHRSAKQAIPIPNRERLCAFAPLR